ncbi:unnamed protein product [Umbelopsis ramanniana]
MFYFPFPSSSRLFFVFPSLFLLHPPPLSFRYHQPNQNMKYLRTLALCIVPLLAIAAPVFVESDTTAVEPASLLLFESLCEYYENVSDEVLEASTLDMLFEDGLYDALKMDLAPLDEQCWYVTARPLLQSTIRVHLSINHANILSHIRPLVAEILPSLLPLNSQQKHGEEDWLPGDRTAEALVPLLYNLNQVVGFRLGAYLTSDAMLKDLADRASMVCKPKDNFALHGQQNLQLPNRSLINSRAHLTSRFEDTKQQLWSQYDEQLDDVVRVVMEDYMDDE